MVGKFFTNGIFRVAALVGLSAFSVKTTTYGFTQYMQGDLTLSLVAATAVQVVLVGAAFLITAPISNGRRVLAAAVYLMAVIISCSGSFLQFDDWLCRPDREARNTKTVCDSTAAYQAASLSALSQRRSILEKERARVTGFLRDEDETGIASGRGIGKGPMWRTIAASSNSIKSLDDQFSLVSEKIRGCTAGLEEQNSQTRCNAASECVASALSQLPADNTLMEELGTFYALLGRTQYGDVFRRPELGVPYPARPQVQVLRAKSMEELFDGSLQDLRSMRTTSVAALVAALVIDGLILLITILDALLGGKQDTENGLCHEKPIQLGSRRQMIRAVDREIRKHGLRA